MNMSPRIIEMSQRFCRGETHKQIGDAFGLSRQRVQQILSKVGISGSDGGARVRAHKRAAFNSKKRNERYIARTGMSYAEFKKMPASVRRAYTAQKRNAKSRGIDWDIKFSDWWHIWHVSGKWEQRGKGYGYCMARKEDSGPYRVNNVYICTCAQNASDQYIWKPYHSGKRKSRTNIKMYEVNGVSRTLSDWAQILGANYQVLYYRIKNGWNVEKALTTPKRKFYCAHIKADT